LTWQRAVVVDELQVNVVDELQVDMVDEL